MRYRPRQLAMPSLPLRPSCRSRAAANLVAASAFAIATAIASSATSAPSTAERKYKEALSHEIAGRHADALRVYEQVPPGDWSAVIRIHVAACKANMGRIKEALEDLEAAKLQSRGDIAIVETAEGHAEEYRSRLARVTIRLVGSKESLVVEIDGALESVAAPLMLDPRQHLIRVLAEERLGGQREVVRREVSFDRGMEVELNIELPGAEPPPPPVPRATPAPQRASSNPRWNALTYTGLGLAGAGLLTGTVAGVAVLTRAGEAKDNCPEGTCAGDAWEQYRSTRTLAHVSEIGFAVAGVGAALAAVGYFVLPGKGTEAAVGGVRVSPWVGATSAGVFGKF